jgi:hypothetical protein
MTQNAGHNAGGINKARDKSAEETRAATNLIGETPKRSRSTLAPGRMVVPPAPLPAKRAAEQGEAELPHQHIAGWCGR